IPQLATAKILLHPFFALVQPHVRTPRALRELLLWTPPSPKAKKRKHLEIDSPLSRDICYWLGPPLRESAVTQPRQRFTCCCITGHFTLKTWVIMRLPPVALPDMETS